MIEFDNITRQFSLNLKNTTKGALIGNALGTIGGATLGGVLTHNVAKKKRNELIKQLMAEGKSRSEAEIYAKALIKDHTTRNAILGGLGGSALGGGAGALIGHKIGNKKKDKNMSYSLKGAQIGSLAGLVGGATAAGVLTHNSVKKKREAIIKDLMSRGKSRAEAEMTAKVLVDSHTTRNAILGGIGGNLIGGSAGMLI